MDIEKVMAAYVTCALWSSVHYAEGPEGDGSPMDDDFGADDIAEEALVSMRADCVAFLEEALEIARDYPVLKLADPLNEERIGHDFWLTRNGHGAGFWDRGYGELGDKLTAAAKAYGSSDLYAGDDGKVYVS